MSDQSIIEPGPTSALDEEVLEGRRDFLIGLGRWSKVVIGAAVFGGLALPQSDAEAGWINRRGGGGGGGGWINRHGGGGGGWVNRHGGGWVNRHGGGGGWINRR